MEDPEKSSRRPGRGYQGDRTADDPGAYLQDVIDQAPLAVHILSAEGICLLANRMWDEIWDLQEGETSRGKSIFEDDQVRAAGLLPYVAESLEGVSVVTQPLFYDPARALRGGSARWLRLLAYPVTDASGEVRRVTLMLEDVTENKRLQDRLAHSAFHDELTGLANRALLMDRLRHALARVHRNEAGGRGLALVFMDLDNFKWVNDSMGHTVGDELLQQVGKRLVNCTRELDTVARFGGDEFVVVLEDLPSEKQAVKALDKIVRDLRPPFVLGGQEVHTTISAGMAFEGPEAEGPAREEDLVRKADLAMYRAKREGKNRTRVFDDSMDAGTNDRLALDGALRQALAKDELVLFYQPQVDAVTGRIVGLEGLVRWEHPQRGLIPPDGFIPFAEENGLISEVGLKVLQDACLMVKRIEGTLDGPSPTVWINVSASQLYNRGFADAVGDALRKTGARPGSLGVEITESVAMDHVGLNLERTAEIMSKLRSLGVKIAIDDFGTGYSSLSYLKRLPVDLLKVDRTFVSGLGRTTGDEAIVTAIVGLADAMDLGTVAEGVETEEQLLRARDLGCNVIQGYLFDRPLPAEKLLNRLEDPSAYKNLLEHRTT